MIENRDFLEKITKKIEDHAEEIRSKIKNIEEAHNELIKIKNSYEAALQLFCLENPRIGDFWHEMYSPVLVVVDVHENQDLTICEETKNVDDKSYEFDLLKSIRISKEEFFKKLKTETLFNHDVKIMKEGGRVYGLVKLIKYNVIPQRIPSIQKVYLENLKKSFEN